MNLEVLTVCERCGKSGGEYGEEEKEGESDRHGLYV